MNEETDVGDSNGEVQYFSSDEEAEEIEHTLIERDYSKKPFLGGYRHKHTGVEYVHASTQTPSNNKALVVQKEKFHRETQTVESANKAIQPKRDCGTQMDKIGEYLDDSAMKVQKAIKIQTCVRGWLARKKADVRRQELEDHRSFLRNKELEREQIQIFQREIEIERRRNPKTNEDFQLLYSELEAWCTSEKQRINEMNLTAEQKKAALFEILSKQTKFLQTIDKLKSKALSDKKQDKVQQQLKQMSSSKKWSVGAEALTKVHTPYTIRAKELKHIYNALNLPLLTIAERTDVLLQAKLVVQEFECLLTRDIIELIDREVDLLNRGRSESSLQALRKRLSNLFLQFVETPEFNPEAAKYQKIKTVRSNTLNQ